MNSITKNPITTTGGIMGLIVLAIQAIQAVASGDLTSVDWNEVVLSAGLIITGLSARQSNVSSEKAGAK